MMDKTICYSFDEFKNRYPILLDSFLNDWEDNTEKDFLDYQKQLYNECIDNTTIKYRERVGFCFVEPISVSLEEVHNKISEYVEFENAEIFQRRFRLRVKNIDLCDNYNRTFKKIKEFINSKIAENKPEQFDLSVKLSIPQIALKHFYEVGTLTRDEAKIIIIGTGHTSGDALYNKFCFYSITENRRGNPQNSVKLRNMINLLKSVIYLLPENRSKKAIDELKLLKTHLS